MTARPGAVGSFGGQVLALMAVILGVARGISALPRNAFISEPRIAIAVAACAAQQLMWTKKRERRCPGPIVIKFDDALPDTRPIVMTALTVDSQRAAMGIDPVIALRRE